MKGESSSVPCPPWLLRPRVWITQLNPLSANSDQQQFSPNNIHTLSRNKVMRINEMITKEKMPRSFIKFSQLIHKGNVWRSVWRICMWILGLKGLKLTYHAKSMDRLYLCSLKSEETYFFYWSCWSVFRDKKMERVISRTTSTMASHAEVLRGSSRVSAPRTSFMGQERVTNPA